MDARYFLEQRTSFIRYYFDNGARAFIEIMHKIENGLPPFDNPPYSEEPEPPFLEEWINAHAAIELHARACVSLLWDSLKLYLEAWRERVAGFVFTDPPRSGRFLEAYREAIGEILDTDFSDCPVDFARLEQVVLARHRSQHGVGQAQR